MVWSASLFGAYILGTHVFLGGVIGHLAKRSDLLDAERRHLAETAPTDPRIPVLEGQVYVLRNSAEIVRQRTFQW